MKCDLLCQLHARATLEDVHGQQGCAALLTSKACTASEWCGAAQMSAASTGITTESDADDAAHAGDADDMEEEYVGACMSMSCKSDQHSWASVHMSPRPAV